jgi:hypothetical protein
MVTYDEIKHEVNLQQKINMEFWANETKMFEDYVTEQINQHNETSTEEIDIKNFDD